MFELTFLGTSASAPSIYRGLSAQMVAAEQHRFLIDCGEGTQRQILKSGLGFKRLNHILLTHAHLDHILGLAGLLSTLTRWEALEDIYIYGGSATLQRVKKLLYEVVFPNKRPPIPVHLIKVKDGDTVFEDKKYTVTAFHVQHQGTDNLGYCFQERTYRPFLPERAAALQVPAGPERGQLVAGQSITLADGRIIHPDDVLGTAEAGAKLVHVGDCGSTANLQTVAQDADCLVMEATYIDEEKEMARRFAHMTAGDAARFAQAANVGTLILTHISRRSREMDVRREAESYYPNTVVARDFDHFIITRGKRVRKEQARPSDDTEAM